MSRSIRKPYVGNHGGSKNWKRKANRSIRRNLSDFIDGAFFKKLNDVWLSPMEDRHCFWDVPKMRRK